MGSVVMRFNSAAQTDARATAVPYQALSPARAAGCGR